MKNSREHENKNHGTKSGALTTTSKNAANVARNKTATVNLEPPQPLEQDDRYNYALLIALYTLQGIPLGLSASIPFLIQQKVKAIAEAIALSAATSATSTDTITITAAAAATILSESGASVSKISYNAQAIFSLVSWPFSLKLLWAPIVDAIFLRRWGRRKSWLVPTQLLAGLLMVCGSDYVEDNLGVDNVVAEGLSAQALDNFDVTGVTLFFFALYFLMATQDIAVDGWALTMLSKRNRGRGPVCNSIGQNIGFFLAFVGFLALNDAESSETLWRPLFRLKSQPGVSIISLGGFIRSMGCLMIAVTCFVAIFKKEQRPLMTNNNQNRAGLTAQNKQKHNNSKHKKQRIDKHDGDDDDDDAEVDASEIGIRETYKRLWAVCQLPAVRTLFLVLLTCRVPTVLSDKVKFLKAVEFGLSKQTTALLAPTIILPLGIAVPIIAAKIWKSQPLTQWMTAYKLRVTLVPLLDILMLLSIRSLKGRSTLSSAMTYWITIVASTALSSMVDAMQFNAQMVFFAQRVDPEIGGSYMTLLNTVANLGPILPQPAIMYLMGQLTVEPVCVIDEGSGGGKICEDGRDAYFPLSILLSVLGCTWIYIMGAKVKLLGELPEKSWRTHAREEDGDEEKNHDRKDMKAA